MPTPRQPERLGHRAEVAASGREAVRALEHQPRIVAKTDGPSGDQQGCRQSGMEDLVEKPARKMDLVKVFQGRD
jgi:CheY-like chemotaxis protein